MNSRHAAAMKLPQRVVIRILADAGPIAGMFVTLEIKTRCKNSFALAFGPSDTTGTVIISRESILAEADKSREMFLMDYGHPEADFTGEIGVEPMHRETIGRALEAFKLYGGIYPYVEGYAANLQKALAILHEVHPKELGAEVRCEDPEIVFRIHSVPA